MKQLCSAYPSSKCIHLHHNHYHLLTLHRWTRHPRMKRTMKKEKIIADDTTGFDDFLFSFFDWDALEPTSTPSPASLYGYDTDFEASIDSTSELLNFTSCATCHTYSKQYQQVVAAAACLTMSHRWIYFADFGADRLVPPHEAVVPPLSQIMSNVRRNVVVTSGQ